MRYLPPLSVGYEKAPDRVTAGCRKCFEIAHFFQSNNLSKTLYSVFIFRKLMVHYEPLALRRFFGRRKKNIFSCPAFLFATDFETTSFFSAGGTVQSLAWDPTGSRIAVIFKGIIFCISNLSIFRQ